MNLSGVFPPIATPFDVDGEVDPAAIRSNVARWMPSGVRGIVALGSNGEAPLVDEKESDVVIAAAREAVPGDRVLIAGTGRESTRGTIDASRRAATLGADAGLVRTPSYFKPRMTPDAFAAHYTAVADGVTLPVILYNYPAVTGVNLTADTVARLARHPNIIGIKETSTDAGQIAAYIDSTSGEDFAVLAGSAPAFYAALCLGARGAILAAACVVPRLCVELFDAFTAGDHAKARRLQRLLLPIAVAVTSGHGVPGLKAAMELAGYTAGKPRAPLSPASDDAVVMIRGALAPLEEVLVTVPRRLLLGPGPSPVSDRVMGALASPVLSHLDPYLLDVLDTLRVRLRAAFRAGPDALTMAISGTGTSGMEAAVANVTKPGTTATVVVTGYFGDRLAQMLERYGAQVHRIEVEWGRACDPARVEQALKERRADIVAVVHAETSTGVLNPVDEIARIAAQHGALLIVDAVTSLGGMPVDVAKWGTAVCYSCSQKGLGAPSGLAPIAFSAAALERRVSCRSFYFDLALLEDYWLRRKYHHTISAPLILSLNEALAIVEEEGLDARHARHYENHTALAAGLDALGLGLLPPEGERLWTLNAVRVPDGVDEAAVRRQLLQDHGIEIGAGLGPLAGRIWRVGLMGAGSSRDNVQLFLTALGTAVAASRSGAPVRQ